MEKMMCKPAGSEKSNGLSWLAWKSSGQGFSEDWLMTCRGFAHNLLAEK
jgi:hypothetical protein